MQIPTIFIKIYEKHICNFIYLILKENGLQRIDSTIIARCRFNLRVIIYPAISTFAVQICYTNKFFSLRINFPGTLYM